MKDDLKEVTEDLISQAKESVQLLRKGLDKLENNLSDDEEAQRISASLIVTRWVSALADAFEEVEQHLEGK